MTHHFPFFSLSSSGPSLVMSAVAEPGAKEPPSNSTEGRPSTGDMALGEVITPWALSREVRPVGGLENHPPGKNKEDVVDSSRLRSLGAARVSPIVSRLVNDMVRTIISFGNGRTLTLYPQILIKLGMSPRRG